MCMICMNLLYSCKRWLTPLSVHERTYGMLYNNFSVSYFTMLYISYTMTFYCEEKEIYNNIIRKAESQICLSVRLLH